MPQVTTSTCVQLHRIFHLSVILSLKPKFCKKIHLLDFFCFSFLEKKVSAGKRGGMREVEEGGWAGNMSDGLLIFTRCRKGQRALLDSFKVPRVVCLRGQEGSNLGFDPSLFPSCHHHCIAALHNDIETKADEIKEI